VRGVGESTAAITVVNALPLGIGAAIGIDLKVRAEIELHPAGSTGRWEVRMSDAARTPLVVTSLDLALNRFAPGSSGTGALSLASEVPASRGLKSSSAVSSAIALSVAAATDTAVEPLEIARLSAEITRSARVSATGAMDDALAGLVPELVVTDNRRGELLRSFPVDPELEVALLVSRTTHRPSPDWIRAFEREGAPAQVAVDAALTGDWAVAMERNSEVVERVMGYDYASLRARLRSEGAVGSGVTGMGPALAAVAPRASVERVARTLPTRLGEHRVLRFSAAARRERGAS